MGSVHCIAMCGPIAMMVPGSNGKNKIVAALLYNGGKILSYILIGLLFGVLTSFITSFKIQAIITISAGLIITLLAFTPALISLGEKQGYIAFSSLINFKNKMSKALDKNRLEFGFYIGFLNGFIPCGMVYIAAIGAMVQPSVLDSGLFMLFFGLGTVPVLSAIILASSFLKTRFKSQSQKLKLVALLFVGCFMIYKGISNYNISIDRDKSGQEFQICAN